MAQYQSQTTFERLEAIPGQPIQYVQADCTSILFIALPATTLNGDDLNLVDTGNGYESFIIQAPRVNGVPLMPMVANPNAVNLMPYNRLEQGDRLEFTNAPGVLDRTRYEITLNAEGANNTNARMALMVVRRIVTEIGR